MTDTKSFMVVEICPYFKGVQLAKGLRMYACLHTACLRALATVALRARSKLWEDGETVWQPVFLLYLPGQTIHDHGRDFKMKVVSVKILNINLIISVSQEP